MNQSKRIGVLLVVVGLITFINLAQSHKVAQVANGVPLTAQVILPTGDPTPRVVYVSGMQNEYVDAQGSWTVDKSSATANKLAYCQKKYPATVAIKDYKSETLYLYRKLLGTLIGPYPIAVMTTQCLDGTPRIAYWQGKVNQHVDVQGNWLTDPDGVSGAEADKLAYCQKWYKGIVSVKDYKTELITTWRERNNTGGPYTLSVMTTQCVPLTEKILFLGGATSTTMLNDVYTSPNMLTWGNVSPNTTATTVWSGRIKPEAIYFNNKFWVVGGNPDYNSSIPTTNDVWSSPDGTIWTKVGTAPNAQVPTTTCSGKCFPDVRLAVLGSKIFFISGGFAASSVTAANTIPAKVWSSPDGATWTSVNAQAPFSPREGFMTISYNNKIYVMGGANFGGSQYFPDVWSSPDGAIWTQVTGAAAWGNLNMAKAFVFNSTMYVFGGFVGGAGNSLKGWSSADGANWTLVTSALPLQGGSSFDYIDGVVANGKMWLGASDASGLWCSADGATWSKSTMQMPWPTRFGYRFATNGGTPAGKVDSACNLLP